MEIKAALRYIEDGKLDGVILEKLGISKEKLDGEKKRIIGAVNNFSKLYGEDRDISIFSVGGRSEISGNHTDHNSGKVIAASIDLAVIAVAAKRDDGVVRIKSEGFPEDVILSEEIHKPNAEKYFKSSAIIAGIENAFLQNGLSVGGFDAFTVSNVLKGSGLSSSAAFEVTVAKMMSSLYNDDKVPSIELAKMSQYAENVFFGKPCGLMDQAACAVGGLIGVDFADAKDPKYEKLDFDLAKEGYSLCITDTGANHADLNDDYAAIPSEMKRAASLLGVSHLRETTKEKVLENAELIRREAGDRSLLRALHFFDENERVERQLIQVKAGDIGGFFRNVKESGASSYRYLQNVYTTKNPAEQSVSLALYLSENFLGEKGAFRVHGGGFAGTVQAFVPSGMTEDFQKYMERFFGEGSCLVLSVRKSGAEKII